MRPLVWKNRLRSFIVPMWLHCQKPFPRLEQRRSYKASKPPPAMLIIPDRPVANTLIRLDVRRKGGGGQTPLILKCDIWLVNAI